MTAGSPLLRHTRAGMRLSFRQNVSRKSGTTVRCSGERIMTPPMPQSTSPTPDPPVAMPAADQESFVINLCSSTTPMALTQPKLAELKHYKFFVSRRLEDGRERFRLHMGYFDSLPQAEELLPLVRDIYPGAWAGEAPGKRLRARAAHPVAAPAKVPVAPTLAAAPVQPPAPSPTPAAAPAAAAIPDAAILAKAPTLAPEAGLTLVPPPVLPSNEPTRWRRSSNSSSCPTRAPLLRFLRPCLRPVAPAMPAPRVAAASGAMPAWRWISAPMSAKYSSPSKNPARRSRRDRRRSPSRSRSPTCRRVPRRAKPGCCRNRR